MTAAASDASLETAADQRRYVLRLLRMHFMALIGCAVCIAIATWVLANGIDGFRSVSGSGGVAALTVAGIIAFFCLRGATNGQARMFDAWRDLRRPLPPIDGSEIVLVRKAVSRGDRVFGTVFAVGWIAVGTAIVAYGWPNGGAILLGGYLVLVGLSILRTVWFANWSRWEQPLVIDREGFEDRSRPDGRMTWDEVAGIEWRSGDIVIGLTNPRPIIRKGLSAFFDDMFGLPQRKIEAIKVSGPWLSLDKHRVFRLLQAYWRHSKAGRSRT